MKRLYNGPECFYGRESVTNPFSSPPACARIASCARLRLQIELPSFGSYSGLVVPFAISCHHRHGFDHRAPCLI